MGAPEPGLRTIEIRHGADEAGPPHRDRRPSEAMLPPDGRSYACPWIADSVTIHSDGNVSCGLDDPHASRSYGNVRTQTLAEIFAGEEYANVARKLRAGHRCSPCSHYEEVPEGWTPPERPRLPSTLVIEPTVRCNLRCPNAACTPNNADELTTRSRHDLPLEEFDRVVNELAEGLKTVYFFNYGDPFMHGDAPAMLGHLRRRCPDASVVTSTNGIPLAKRERAAKVVAAEPDFVVFTISGMTQESYARYHARGRLDRALDGLRNVCETRAGRPRVKVVWRYLLFRWNDGIEELEAARALATALGVDQFSLYLTHLPPGASSYRMAPGTPGHARFAPYIDAAHGYRHAGPDAEGLYPYEVLADFGPVRWTSWRARPMVPVRDGKIRLSLSTIRPGRAGRRDPAIVRVPWGVFEVPVQARVWTDIDLPVPEPFRPYPAHPVELMTEAYWFPIDDGIADDTRCLGMVIGGDFGSTLPREAAVPRPRDPALLPPLFRIEAALSPAGESRWSLLEGTERRMPWIASAPVA